ncbi:MAG TPA: polymorphic toxin-type HINT domain-containing protein, partial [Pyrinomonadaceae bacterium]
IFTPRGSQAIETIKENFKVYSFNPATLEIEVDTVRETFVHSVTEYLELYFSGARIPVSVTKEHPFLTESGDFTAAGNLKIKDKVWRYVQGGWQKAVLNRIEKRSENTEVYNFRVAKNQTYLANRFAVHNTKLPPEIIAF